MIVTRDPAFWGWVIDHPQVAGSLQGLSPDVFANLAQSEWVKPFASENGGYLFLQMDGLGRVWEVHAVFRPEGWGREASETGKAALDAFDWQLITTSELPSGFTAPRSFGFRPTGGFEPSPLGPLRTWMLTRAAWEASPARRRKCPLSS